MAIRSVPQSLPNQLPPARLYLDDLAELIQILSAGYDEPRVTFTVGNRVCDTLEDLGQLGSRATEIQIEVGTRYGSSEIVLARNGTYFFVLGEDKSEGWSKYAKVLAIFEKRKLKLPSSIGTLTTLIAAALPFSAIFLHHTLRWFSLFVEIGLLLLLANLYIRGSHSVVEFRYSHKVGAKRWLEDQRTAIAMLVIGSVLGVVGAVVSGLVAKAMK